jgi:hypothetical protein
MEVSIVVVTCCGYVILPKRMIVRICYFYLIEKPTKGVLCFKFLLHEGQKH